MVSDVKKAKRKKPEDGDTMAAVKPKKKKVPTDVNGTPGVKKKKKKIVNPDGTMLKKKRKKKLMSNSTMILTPSKVAPEAEEEEGSDKELFGSQSPSPIKMQSPPPLTKYSPALLIKQSQVERNYSFSPRCGSGYVSASHILVFFSFLTQHSCQ